MITANSHSEDPVEVVAAVQVGYVLGGWVAMVIHCFATELYVSSLDAQVLKTRGSCFAILILLQRCDDADYSLTQLYLTPAEAARLRRVSKSRMKTHTS